MVNATLKPDGGLVLLGMEKVIAVGPGGEEFQAIDFHDTGSTISLVEHAWAQANNLPSKPIKLHLAVLNEDYEELKTLEN